MTNLKFLKVDNPEHNTISLYVENATVDITNEDFKILDRTPTKYKYEKVKILILKKDLKDQLKIWEVQINDYLKSEIGTAALTLLYGNKIYCKVSESIIGLDKEILQLNIKSIWINENNKAFVQLYYIHHT